MTRIERVTKELNDAGIYLTAITRDDSGAGTTTLYYQGTPSQAMIDTAEAIVTAFDWTPRSIRTFDAILTDIDSLLEADRTTLFQAAAAKMLQMNPYLGRRAGLTIDGDYPEWPIPKRRMAKDKNEIFHWQMSAKATRRVNKP
jgi:hypothetical protein